MTGLRHLDLSWCGLYQGASWLVLLNRLINNLSDNGVKLTRIRLNNSLILQTTLRKLLGSFPLEELSIEGTKFFGSSQYSAPMRTDCFAEVKELPKTLCALNVAGSHISSNSLRKVLEKSKQSLKHLNVSNCAVDLGGGLFKELDLVSLQAWRCSVSEEGGWD